ncbi:MAG: hypothetical protein ACJ788_06235 [Ktedonobacteraceae bacterium]
MSINQSSTVIGIFEERERAMQALQDLEEAGFQEDQMDLMFRTGVPMVSKVDTEAEGHAVADNGGLLENIRGTAHELLKPILDLTAANTTRTTATTPEEQAVATTPTAITPAATIAAEEQAVDTIPTVTIPAEKQAIATPQNAEDDTDKTQKISRVPIDKPTNITDGHHEEIPSPTEAPVKEEETAIPANDKSAGETSAPVLSGKITLQEQMTRACVGALAGAFLGLVLALLIRVINAALVGSPLVVVFYAILGAMVGGVFGAFLRIRALEERSLYYPEGDPKRTIVAVKTDEHQEKALNILYRHGASYASIHDRPSY